jgi:hypothetical protein
LNGDGSFAVAAGLVLLHFLPDGKLTFRLGLGQPVYFVNLVSKLISLNGNHVQLIIGKFAQPLPDTAFELLAVKFYLIPVHLVFLSMDYCRAPLASLTISGRKLRGLDMIRCHFRQENQATRKPRYRAK